jgi:hypothetical protein
MFERISGDELAGIEALARRVRNELAAAGLPVVPDVDPVLAGGAMVEVDDGADMAGGVFAGWSASPRLRECTSRAFGLRMLDDPLLRHSSQIAACRLCGRCATTKWPCLAGRAPAQARTRAIPAWKRRCQIIPARPRSAYGLGVMVISSNVLAGVTGRHPGRSANLSTQARLSLTSGCVSPVASPNRSA